MFFQEKGNDHGSSPTKSTGTLQSPNSLTCKGYIKFRQKKKNIKFEKETNEPEKTSNQAIEKREPNAGNGFDEKEYYWYQTQHEVVIKIPLSSKVSTKDFKVDFKEDKLRVKVRTKELIFDKITKDQVVGGDKNLFCYHPNDTHYTDDTDEVITVTLKKEQGNNKRMWSHVANEGQCIDIERVNPTGMPTSQFICITTDDCDRREVIEEKIKFFENFPKKPKCLISLHGSINEEDVCAKNIRDIFSAFVEQTEDILIVTDGLTTGASQIIGELIKDFELENRSHVDILAITGKPNLQSKTMTSGVMHVDYDEDNKSNLLDSGHRWFIFIDGSNTAVRYERIDIEKNLTTDSSVCMVLLGDTRTYFDLMKAYSYNGIPIILLQPEGLSQDVIGCMNTKQELGNKQQSKDKRNKKIAKYGREFADFILGNKMQILPKIPSIEQTTVNMFFIRGVNKSEYTYNICDLIISLVWKESVQITALERARFLVKESFEKRLGGWIKYIDEHLEHDVGCKCKYKKNDFKRLRETFYLLHYAVHTTMREKRIITKHNLLKSLEVFEGKKASQGSYCVCRRKRFNQKPTIHEDQNVYKKLLDLTEGAFVRKGLNEEFKYSDLLQELYIWSLMCNQQDLAVCLCRALKDILANCLVAHRVLFNMSSKTDDDKIKHDFRYNASKFEDFAVKIIRKYQRQNDQDENTNTVDGKPMTSGLENKPSRWNGKSYLDFAIENENKAFLAEEMCQKILNQRWMGELSIDNSNKNCWLCIIFPPLIFFLIKEADFQINDASSSIFFRWITRLYKFYTSPYIVHIHNLISYIVFLLLFTYLNIVELTVEFSWLEVMIIIWVVSFLSEEIRQLMETTAPSMRAKIVSYWKSGWNKMDVASTVLFVAGVSCRIVSVGHEQKALEATRILYAVSLLLFHLRVLNFWSINKILGPRLLMIYLMLKELAVFLAILLVFVISYSISAHSVAYPNSKLDWRLPWNVFRLGIWNIYGEFLLDEIELTEPNCSFNETESIINMIPQCPTLVSKYFSSILLMLYFIITNVLLLNLLIAVFNQKFETVSTQSEITWKWQRITFISECVKKPPLIYPFILVAHVWKLLSLCRNSCGRREYEAIYQDNTDEAIKQDNLDDNPKWDKRLASYYRHFNAKRKIEKNISALIKHSEGTSTQMNVKISNLQKKTEALSTQINDKIKKENEALMKHIDTKMEELLEAVQQSRTSTQH